MLFGAINQATQGTSSNVREAADWQQAGSEEESGHRADGDADDREGD